MTVMLEKQKLRSKIRELEKTLTSEYKLQSGIEICKRLELLPEFQSAESVFCFVGINSEPDTSTFLKSVLNSGKRLCLPLCTGKGIMELREINSTTELSNGAYGIPEPPETAPMILPREIDIAIVPCLCCDYHGNRLGKGGGFYDRFLTDYSGTSVMLCFEKLIQSKIPIDKHDCSVPYVLSEQGLYINGSKVL